MRNKILLMLFLAIFLQADSLPLQGKRYGVEFNIPRLLTYSESWKSASGTFSYFRAPRKTPSHLTNQTIIQNTIKYKEQ